MNLIMNFVEQYDYYYLIRQGYITHFEKLIAVKRVSIEKYIFVTDRPIFLDNLKIKLCQVKAKNLSFCPNKTLFGANNIYNRVVKLTCIDIKEFKKWFAHNLDYEKNTCNSYQADWNQNYWTLEEYYIWTQDYTRLEKAIRLYKVNYLADKQCQTITKMMNTLQDITSIKFFEQYEMLITLNKLQKSIPS